MGDKGPGLLGLGLGLWLEPWPGRITPTRPSGGGQGGPPWHWPCLGLPGDSSVFVHFDKQINFLYINEI